MRRLHTLDATITQEIYILQIVIAVQGGRSCAGARVAPAEKFGLGRKYKYTLFCRELRFVAIYAFFRDLWAKKCLFGSKTVFPGQEVHYYVVYIAYFTELILQICDYSQKRRI